LTGKSASNEQYDTLLECRLQRMVNDSLTPMQASLVENVAHKMDAELINFSQPSIPRKEPQKNSASCIVVSWIAWQMKSGGKMLGMLPC